MESKMTRAVIKNAVKGKFTRKEEKWGEFVVTAPVTRYDFKERAVIDTMDVFKVSVSGREYQACLEWAEKTLGLECQLWFYECGVGLLGEYEGGETTYYDLPRDAEQAQQALNEIPEYLINAFRLEEEFNMMFEE
jgi:hypothetical protein